MTIVPTRRRVLTSIGGGVALSSIVLSKKSAMADPNEGLPLPISDPAQITGPGAYSLQNDVDSLFLTQYNNVTLFSNGYTVTGTFQCGSPDGLLSGIRVFDLNVTGDNASAWGNRSPEITTPAIEFWSVNVATSDTDGAFIAIGNNMYFAGCSFVSNAQLTNDTVGARSILFMSAMSHVTWAGCSFAGNSNFGLEGVGGWNNVTIKGCTSARDGNHGIGGVWDTGVQTVNFTLTNCTFVDNTVYDFVFALPGGGDFSQALSDDQATALWPGNIFAGNTYLS